MELLEIVILGLVFCWAIFIVYRAFFKKKGGCSGCASSGACQSVTKDQC